jgi:hypothetical protein
VTILERCRTNGIMLILNTDFCSQSEKFSTKHIHLNVKGQGHVLDIKQNITRAYINGSKTEIFTSEI